MIKIDQFKLLILLYYLVLFLNGTFFLIDQSLKILILFSTLIIITLYLISEKHKSIYELQINNIIINLKKNLLFIIPLIFISVYFLNNYSQEFPFSGDYKLHAENSLNINQFLLSSYFNKIDLKNIDSYKISFLFLNLLISNLALFIFFFIFICYFNINKITLILILFLQLAISYTAEYNLTYPSGTYILSLPFNTAIYFFKNISLMESIRFLNFLAPILWLFIFRPILINEKANLNILLISIFILWQLEFIYLFTSNYNEPFAIISLLLAFEMAIKKRNILLIPFLLGLATCFKLVNIFFIPVFFIIMLPEYLKKKKLFYNFFVYCLFSIPFLFFYQNTRMTGKVDRTLSWSLNNFNLENLNEFLFRLNNIFSFFELIAFVILLIILFFQRKPFWEYYKIIIIIISSILFFFMFFLDILSVAWIGYLRFYYYFYIILLSLIFFINFQKLGKLLSLIPFLIFLVLFFSNYNKNLNFTFLDDYKKSFIFHYEEPIFLPINKLINIYKSSNKIEDKTFIISMPNIYMQPIQDTFLKNNYNFIFEEKLKYNCECINNNFIYINSFLQRYNLNNVTFNYTPIYYKKWGNENRININFIDEDDKNLCVKKIYSTCSNVYEYKDKNNIVALISSND